MAWSHLASPGRKGDPLFVPKLHIQVRAASDPTDKQSVPGPFRLIKQTSLLEVPRLHLQRINMQVAHEDVPRLRHSLRPVPRIAATHRAMRELIATP